MRRREFITLLGGAVAFWPLAARAQQTKPPTVGVLVSTAANDWSARMAAFRQGLSEAGYTEGSNVALVYRYAEYHYDRLPALALDLVRQNVDVMLASGGDNSIKAAMAATSTIPIVFITANDPVTAGYVKSLNRPGGNLTGITFLASSLEAKRFELLHQIAPKAASIAVLMGSANTTARTESDLRALEAAAKSLGLGVRVVSIGSEDDFAPAFRDIVARRDDAIHIITDSFFAARARTLAALAATTALPASSSERDFAAGGGLLSYGASSTSPYRDAGAYAGRILKGAAPSELPVQESTKIEFIINLKTAKSLGLTVPLPLLGLADEVVE
jgi:putative tryptophan/tyrosine transport system substrate-binding protein